MKMGKISETILKRSVFKQIRHKRKEVIQGAKVGVDSAIIDVSDKENIAITSAPVYGLQDLAVYMGVVHAINNLKASGATPFAVEDVILLPEDFNEQELRQIVNEMELATKENDMQISGGHTQIVSGLDKPIITLTAIGDVRKVLNPKEVATNMDIVMTRFTGMEGAYLLAAKNKDKLIERYNEYLYDVVMEYKNNLVIKDEALIAINNGAVAIHDIGEGGVFGALWDISELCNKGISIDFKKIPIKQETIEVCELLDINPYALKSTGSLIIVTNNGHQLVEKLNEKNISATVIGYTTNNNDKILVNDDEIRYLEPPKRDEYYRAIYS